MFWKKIDSRRAVASDGSILEAKDRFFYHYCESGKVMRVDVERAPPPFSNAVYVDSMTRWLPPHDLEEISPEKHIDIKKRVGDALDAIGSLYRFV